MQCKGLFSDCKNEHDDRYTMDFGDVEPGAKVYWCSECGPKANEINNTLQTRMTTESGFAEKFEAEIKKAELEQRKEIN